VAEDIRDQAAQHFECSAIGQALSTLYLALRFT
jgi:hypothetical protein